MTTHRRRLATLEDQAGPTRDWTERDESFFAWLSSPSLIVVAGRFAKDLAHRRSGDQWFRFDPADRAARIRIERATFAALLRTGQTHTDALRGWLTEGDTLPPLPWGVGTSYADFVAALARERAMISVHRGWDGPYGVQWRSRHPAWHLGMSPAEMDRWEASSGSSWRP